MTAIPEVIAANAKREADGMAIDSAGRPFVTASAGVHVLSPDGKHLGLIPTPRPPITVAFSGPDKKTLYVAQLGVVGPDGNRGKHLRACGIRR